MCHIQTLDTPSILKLIIPINVQLKTKIMLSFFFYLLISLGIGSTDSIGNSYKLSSGGGDTWDSDGGGGDTWDSNGGGGDTWDSNGGGGDTWDSNSGGGDTWDSNSGGGETWDN